MEANRHSHIWLFCTLEGSVRPECIGVCVCLLETMVCMGVWAAPEDRFPRQVGNVPVLHTAKC